MRQKLLPAMFLKAPPLMPFVMNMQELKPYFRLLILDQTEITAFRRTAIRSDRGIR